ncbi:MAG: sporulation protein YqfD [Firmicutes bacterium]|nr:sporulation protein YqfD [Bacillota bacterium]
MRIKSVSPLRILSLLNQHNFSLSKIQKVSDSEVTFRVDSSEEKRLFEFIKQKNLKIERDGESTRERIINLLKKSVAFFCASVLLFFVFLFLFEVFIFKIEINGADAALAGNIEKIINDTRFRPKSSVDLITLQHAVREANPEIALLSINFIGATLVVNVKQTNETIIRNPQDAIVSSVSGVVYSVSLISGTAMVKTGMRVREGDILIKPEIAINGQSRLVPAVANIVILAVETHQVVFHEARQEFKYTGNTKTAKTLSLFGLKWGDGEIHHGFTHFDKIASNKKSISSHLPIYKTVTTYKEKTLVEINEKFSEKEEELKQQVLAETKKLSKHIGEFMAETVEVQSLGSGAFKLSASVQFLICYN